MLLRAGKKRVNKKGRKEVSLYDRDKRFELDHIGQCGRTRLKDEGTSSDGTFWE